MSFIQGVLQRARGEAGRIRPRRDIPSPGLSETVAEHAYTHSERGVDSAPPDPAPPLPLHVAGDPASPPPASAPHAMHPSPLPAHTAARQQDAIAEPHQLATPSRRSDRAQRRHEPVASDAITATLSRNEARPPHAARSDAPARNASTSVAAHDASPLTAPPSIDIHIGRIEISAPAPSHATRAAASSKPAAQAPLTLAEYLAARNRQR